jgi:hypothetical protein
VGLYDEVWWEAELPQGHPPASRLFQTKSFDRCLDHYVVTAGGRLLLVGNGWRDDTPFEGAPGGQGVDVEYHGDLRLVSVAPKYEEYMARFTHGALESDTADSRRAAIIVAAARPAGTAEELWSKYRTASETTANVV